MIFSRVFMKHGDYKSAFNEMEKVLDLSIMAFTKVKKFEHKVKCKWLSISCRLMIQCFDKSEESFQSLDKIPDKTKKMMAELIFNDLTDVVAKFDTIKVPIMKKMASDPKKKEQKALNDLLEATLPLIWQHVELFRSPETWTKGKAHEKVLKYMPQGSHWRHGSEQGAKIPIGDGESITVWKNETSHVGKYVDEPFACMLSTYNSKKWHLRKC